MERSRQKRTGAYYTPDAVVRSLVRWAVRRDADCLLDPSCGDGRFLAEHANSVGVEQDPEAVAAARSRAPAAQVHHADFFEWATHATQRFECAAGNPPFIRYQRFAGDTRKAALHFCESQGAHFSELTSSWAPFIVAVAALLKPGGRMAFVVPAEIGHAPYARPVMEYLARTFATVQVVAVREKLFPELSEDCWLLYADGYGQHTDHYLLSRLERMRYLSEPPIGAELVSQAEWKSWHCRLRPFLLSREVLSLYLEQAGRHGAKRLGEIAKVGIGYVTGANDFFHLAPSKAQLLRIPDHLLRPAVRNGGMLTGRSITTRVVQQWRERDEPMLLLDLANCRELPEGVKDYLDSPEARAAKEAYKCRTRTPWYAVPDVAVPDGFLAYMSGGTPALVANPAGCVASNGVHMLRLKGGLSMGRLQKAWRSPLTTLSCEVEGHPLGGGILKLEPGEASRVLVTQPSYLAPDHLELLAEGISTMRQWRHQG